MCVRNMDFNIPSPNHLISNKKGGIFLPHSLASSHEDNNDTETLNLYLALKVHLKSSSDNAQQICTYNVIVVFLVMMNAWLRILNPSFIIIKHQL